jgi:hypothetical protein
MNEEGRRSMDWNLIPQVFYDLLSRVIPGFVAILAWYLAALGPLEAIESALVELSNKDSQILNLWSSTIIFVLAYVLGFILEGLWALTFEKLRETAKSRAREKHWQVNSVDEYNTMRVCLNEPELKFESAKLPPSYTMLDQARLHLPSEIHRLLKLRGERRLCERIFLTCSLSVANLAVFLLIYSNWRTFDRIAMLILAGIAAFCLWPLGKKFDKFFTMGICTTWLLINFPIGSPGTAKSDQKKPD